MKSYWKWPQKTIHPKKVHKIEDYTQGSGCKKAQKAEDVEESRKDVKHRRRRQLVKSMRTVGKLLDKHVKGEMELDLKTKKKKSLAMEAMQEYVIEKERYPDKYRERFSLDHLDRLHELTMRRADL